ncbi:response regulator transcription factor [Alkalihalobacterium bogoriense]|uniref:response regulator transcription factor n=1 Tax=Alkalihalobacterium bogoriense TaxID=246272 RepID=UPI0004797114|nr:LuxR C-terminal-related transcriptional regulator [Alkalihalobacterium bogoriense]
MTSLNRHMEYLIEEGIHILQKNEMMILQEWKKFSEQQLFMNDEYMTSKEDEFKEQLWLVIELLQKYVFHWQYTNYHQWMDELQDDWTNYHSHIDSHHLVLIFSLLEKGAHKVSQQKSNVNYYKYQSIQYFFDHVFQRLLNYSSNKVVDLSSYVRHLFSLEPLPIHWVVRVKQEEQIYAIKDIIQNKEQENDGSWLNMLKTLKSESLNLLTSAVTSLVQTKEREETLYVFSIQVKHEVLLFFTPEHEWQPVKDTLQLSIKMYERNFESYTRLTKQNQWKDSLLFFQQWMIQSKGVHELIERIASGYVRYFPFERCAFFSYKDTEKMSIGLTGYQLNTDVIKTIKENITTVQLINKNVKDLSFYRPLYYASAITCLPEHYIKQFKLKSIVIAPIYTLTENKLLGSVILDQGEHQHFEVSNETMIALQKVGHLVGEVLMKYQDYKELYLQHALSSRLSRREIEVLQMIKNGDSIEEIAEYLNLSKYTVRDYISSSIKRMNAKNRIHAVAMAIQQGLIS